MKDQTADRKVKRIERRDTEAQNWQRQELLGLPQCPAARSAVLQW